MTAPGYGPGIANQIGFDNITIGSTASGRSIPTLNESTVVLLALLVAIAGGVMLLRRRVRSWVFA